MRLLIAIIFCISFSVAANSQPVTVAAMMDSTRLLIGDQTKLHLMVNHAPEVKIEAANIAPFADLAEVELIDIQPNWDTLKKGKEWVLQKDLTIQAFDSGSYWIPAIPITYIHNGRKQTIRTDRIPLEVTTVATDSIYIAPIKPIEAEPITWRDLWPFALGLLLLGLFGWLLYYFLNRETKKEIPPEPEIIIPAHEIALSNLGQLKQKQLWQKGKIKQYQSELTYIVREYLENRYNIQALESTTDEIVRDLHTTGVDQVHRKNLQDMFMMADMVKFAKAKPPADAHERLMQEAEQFIQNTKKIEIVVDETSIDKKGDA